MSNTIDHKDAKTTLDTTLVCSKAAERKNRKEMVDNLKNISEIRETQVSRAT